MNQISAYYDEEESIIESCIEDYDDELNQISAYYDEEESIIESCIEDYEEDKNYLDSCIKEYEKHNANMMKYDIEYYQKNETKYYGYSEDYDYELCPKLDGMLYEKEYDNFNLGLVNNNLDYGNLHETDNFSDYLDYKGIDTIDISENREKELFDEFLVSFETEMYYKIQFEIDDDFDKYEEDFYEEDYKDIINYEDQIDTLNKILLIEREINQNTDAEIEHLIENHNYEDKKHDEAICSYLSDMNNEKQDLLNSIKNHFEEYAEEEIDDFEGFDEDYEIEDDFEGFDEDYEIEDDFEGFDEDYEIEDDFIDEFSNITLDNSYFNENKYDKFDSLNDEHFYGDYQYEED